MHGGSDGLRLILFREMRALTAPKTPKRREEEGTGGGGIGAVNIPSLYAHPALYCTQRAGQIGEMGLFIISSFSRKESHP